MYSNATQVGLLSTRTVVRLLFINLLMVQKFLEIRHKVLTVIPTQRERRHLFTVEQQLMMYVSTKLYTELYYSTWCAVDTIRIKLRRII